MNSNLPRTLTYKGSIITCAGPGRVAGSAMYYDAIQQRLITLFTAEVTTTGSVFSTARVGGNPQMARVRVEHTAIANHIMPAVGDSLLIADVEYKGAVPVGGVAWNLGRTQRVMARTAAPVPQAGRDQGTVIFAHPAGWCKASCDSNGQEVFIHPTQWRPTSPIRVGLRVSFVAARTERGVAGYDVKLVA